MEKVANVMRYLRGRRKLRAREPPKANQEHLVMLANFTRGVPERTSPITVTTTNNFYFYFSDKKIEIQRG